MVINHCVEQFSSSSGRLISSCRIMAGLWLLRHINLSLNFRAAVFLVFSKMFHRSEPQFLHLLH